MLNIGREIRWIAERLGTLGSKFGVGSLAGLAVLKSGFALARQYGFRWAGIFRAKGGAQTTTHGTILLAVRFSEALRLGDECNAGVGIRRTVAQKRQLCHARLNCSIFHGVEWSNLMNVLN